MSKGSLIYPGKGMHWDVISSKEWEGLDGYWYRVELYRDNQKPWIERAMSYRRKLGSWLPFKGNSQTAMEIRRLEEIHEQTGKGQ